MRGGPAHRVYSVVVFVILASLDNVAIGLVPPLYGSIGADLGVSEARIALATTVMFLLSAVAGGGPPPARPPGWFFRPGGGGGGGGAPGGAPPRRKPVLVAGTLIWVA